MWPFNNKKSLSECGLFEGFTDWHCHLLPSVDDGVQTMEETLEILKMYESLGVISVWLTPHVMEDVPNDPASLNKRFEELQSNYKGEIKLRLASENMMDNLLHERLEANNVAPIGAIGDHLLIETSYFTPPFDIYDTIDRVKKAGYFPLLAHPERYVYMQDKDYDDLHNAGAKFQLNLYSLTGMYGKEPAEKARKLMKKGYYNVVGTDTHRLKQLKMALEMKSFTNSDISTLKSLIQSCV